jgi:hypothetical protein
MSAWQGPNRNRNPANLHRHQINQERNLSKNATIMATEPKPPTHLVLGVTVAPLKRLSGGFLEEKLIPYLAVEEPLEIQLCYGTADTRRVKSISVTMRTPGHDFELAAGFLMTEGVVSDSADISEISYASGRSNSADSPPQDINKSDDQILPYQPERNVV